MSEFLYGMFAAGFLFAFLCWALHEYVLHRGAGVIPDDADYRRSGVL